MSVEVAAPQDPGWMVEALRIARRADFRTSPNPMVGALVVSGGLAVGRGYHRRAGEPHAEVLALREAGAAAIGATMYVTLEPCGRWGRTPPCTDAIIAAGIAEVVIACEEPSADMRGQGIRQLTAAGVRVRTGVMSQEAARLNEFFFCHALKARPFISLKWATSLDGKIATSSGTSRWITSPQARAHVHRLRHVHDAVLIGVGTVLADDPELTVRTWGRHPRQPLRIVVDSRLRLPLRSRVLGSGSAARTLVATTEAAPAAKVQQVRDSGAEVAVVASRHGLVDLASLMSDLAGRGILSVLVEGGSQVTGSLVDAGLFDRIYAFSAPLVIGGLQAPSPVAGAGAPDLERAARLTAISVRRFGDDVLYIADQR